ncbi:MAG TPA: hypothetical protein VLL25_17610 [Acidimicrobiales bacterium]|nr:hypothetical protein [Acidimicrobiales bacterium]
MVVAPGGNCQKIVIDAIRLLPLRVVDEGDLITGGGVTCGLDVALWLVEKNFGRRLADGIADGIEYGRTRSAL